MDAVLLRNLGFDEALIQALQKSHGEYKEIEILQDHPDLRLLLNNKEGSKKSHILTIPGYFKKDGSRQKVECDILPVPAGPYNCRDVIEFLAHARAAKPNVKINDVGIRLGEAPLKLLRYLAEKLVDTQTGWVYIQDIRSEGAVPSDGYQAFSRLRAAVAGYLLEKNGNDFIEASGRKQYRLSIDPKNVRFPGKP